MTNEERDLNFFVISNVKSKEIINYLYQISRHIRSMDILRYLVKNKIVGHAFIHEIAFSHQGSILNFMAFILKKIDHDVEKRQMIVGKDWN